MLWRLRINPDENCSVDVSIIIEAQTWRIALRDGLKQHGLSESALTQLSYRIGSARSVLITHKKTDNTYFLAPADDMSKPSLDRKPNANMTIAGKITKVGPSSVFNFEEKMETAFEKMQEIYEINDHDEAARFITPLACELIPCEGGSCMYVSPQFYELYIAAANGPAASKLTGKKISMARGIAGFAVKTGHVVSVSSPENDPRFDQDVDLWTGFSTQSVLCAPMQYENEVVGVLELVNSADEQGFSQDEADLLSYLATAFATYVATSLPSRQSDFTDSDFQEATSGVR